MRTTLTLDPDVERLLEDEVHRLRRPFKQVVNDAIRRGLAPRPRKSSDEPFRVQPWPGHLRPGIDPAGFNRLVEQLDDERVLGRLGRSK